MCVCVYLLDSVELFDVLVYKASWENSVDVTNPAIYKYKVPTEGKNLLCKHVPSTWIFLCKIKNNAFLAPSQLIES